MYGDFVADLHIIYFLPSKLDELLFEFSTYWQYYSLLLYSMSSECTIIDAIFYAELLWNSLTNAPF